MSCRLLPTSMVPGVSLTTATVSPPSRTRHVAPSGSEVTTIDWWSSVVTVAQPGRTTANATTNADRITIRSKIEPVMAGRRGAGESMADGSNILVLFGHARRHAARPELAMPFHFASNPAHLA